MIDGFCRLRERGEVVAKAREFCALLKKHMNCFYDETASIGPLYHRDSGELEFVKISELLGKSCCRGVAQSALSSWQNAWAFPERRKTSTPSALTSSAQKQA